MHLDITERRRAEDAYQVLSQKTQQRERLLSALLSSITDQVSILDQEGRFIFANRALLDLWGLTPEQVVGKTFLDLAEPSELATLLHGQVLGVFETSISLGDETSYTSPSGSNGAYEYLLEPVFGGDGKTVDYVAASSRDITERKRSEAALREISEKFELLANNITDVFWIRSPDMRTLHYLSPAFERIWGRSVKSDLAAPDGWKNFIFSEDRERVRNEFASLALETGSREFEYRIERPDGEIRWVLVHGFQVRDSAGTLVRIIGTARDITERKKRESEFGEMEIRFRQSQKMEAVGQLAAGVAHEFNNLLQALMSRATIARLKAVRPEVLKLVSEMETQIRHGAVLTQQLLAFSRQHPLQKEELDLREQVDKAIALLRHLLPENIGIVLEAAPERLSMEGDGGQVQQVILNLAINARDAMPEGGTLTLRSARIGDQIVLEVEDTGEGMNEATRAHIFEPFFTTKEVGKGTGLGLAVVYGIVEQHGGHIGLRSSPGEGSRFQVFFPMISEGSNPLIETPQESAAVPIAGGRVLLVEDEQAVRDGIAMLLELTGYEVTVAGSAEEALETPMEPAPDVLLSDVTLPGLGGFVLGERLCGRWPALKVIMMSGYMPEGAGRPDWKLLQKPFEIEQLASLLAVFMKEATPGGPATSSSTSLGASSPGGGSLVPPAFDGLSK